MKTSELAWPRRVEEKEVEICCGDEPDVEIDEAEETNDFWEAVDFLVSARRMLMGLRNDVHPARINIMNKLIDDIGQFVVLYVDDPNADKEGTFDEDF